MVKLIKKLKQNKLMFAIAISMLIVGILDVFLIIFDITQFILTLNSPVNLGSAFVFLNVFVCIINLICLALFITYLMIYQRKTNSKQIKKR